MDELFLTALKGLIAAGPATAVLGVAAWKLWISRESDRAAHQKELDDQEARHKVELDVERKLRADEVARERALVDLERKRADDNQQAFVSFLREITEAKRGPA